MIAIDNLDRVDSGLALQLWATMRTFFEFDFDTTPCAKPVWLLAAFDTYTLRRMWATASNNSETYPDYGQETSEADSFINKTFQARFDIPSLVLLSRDEYLSTLLKAAFPQHDDRDFQPIVQLYDLWHTMVSTPRSVTTFVNAVGSVHRQWGDEIPLVQQALYAIVSAGRPSIEVILTSPGTPVEYPEELVGGIGATG